MEIRFATMVLLAVISTLAGAQDGGALYKTRCANCHGNQGQGKAKLGTKLAGTSKSEADIASVLTKGGATKAPHVKPMSRLTPEQVQSVAAFVKTLK